MQNAKTITMTTQPRPKSASIVVNTPSRTLLSSVGPVKKNMKGALRKNQMICGDACTKSVQSVA